MADSRTAVVTGASSGIGRAIADRFVRSGLRVVAAGRRADKLTELVDELAGQPGTVLPFVGDMTHPGYAADLLAAAGREWGPASIFVAAAGRGQPGTVLHSDADRWRELIDANYLAILHQLRDCGTEFVARAKADGGSEVRDIVVIGSTVGRQVSAMNPVYGSTKFAVHSLVEALRQEVCGYNVRVTLIEPGFVRSGFQATAGYDAAWFESVAQDYGPLLVPDDVADVVEFVVTRPTHVHLDDIRLRPTRQRV
jgi:NADP-dependent 3-hydroxy acid dehydrogenase YdfG